MIRHYFQVSSSLQNSSYNYNSDEEQEFFSASEDFPSPSDVDAVESQDSPIHCIDLTGEDDDCAESTPTRVTAKVEAISIHSDHNCKDRNAELEDPSPCLLRRTQPRHVRQVIDTSSSDSDEDDVGTSFASESESTASETIPILRKPHTPALRRVIHSDSEDRDDEDVEEENESRGTSAVATVGLPQLANDEPWHSDDEEPWGFSSVVVSTPKPFTPLQVGPAILQSPTRNKAPPLLRLPQTPNQATPSKHQGGNKRAFLKQREALAETLLQEFNERVFKGKLPSVTLEWSQTLHKTAGRAHASSSSFRVELSSKIIDQESRLRNTLAHELCHIAVWHLHGLHQPPHGKLFQSYGQKFGQSYSDITVTRTHSYEIFYKYQYVCTNVDRCGKIYGRHSKSIDVTRKVCGVCRGRLVLQEKCIKQDGTPYKPNPFREFVKENFGRVRTELVEQHERKEREKVDHASVMAQLSLQWKSMKLQDAVIPREQNSSGQTQNE